MIYTKEINGQQVFSTCATIQMPDGAWVSNPSSEQIAEAGWEEYTPPVVPPSPQTEPDLEVVMTAVKKLLSTETDELSDDDALAVAAAFPTWEEKVEEGKEVTTGKRLWYDGRLWKVLQPHTPMRNWTPDTATSLYVEVSIEEWPEWVQPTGAQDAYRIGDHVSYDGRHWECAMDYNTYAPGVYGWSEV